MRTRDCPPACARSRSAVSKPLSLGMRRSSSTTSGRNTVACISASAPSKALRASYPSTVSMAASAVAASRLSSTTRMRCLMVPDITASATESGALASMSAPNGKRTMNSLPAPGPLLCASTVPPCISTRRLTRVRPMPRPLRERCSEPSTCANISKMRVSRAAGIPMPVSFTVSTTASCCRLAPTQIRPASSVYLTALLSRFDNTCVNRVGSAYRNTGCSGRLTVRLCPASSSNGCTVSSALRTTAASSTRVFCRRILSRVMRDKIRLQKTRVELAAVVRSALETVQPLLLEAGHSLTVSLPEQPVFLYADPTRLTQVLSNLLNNAVKYTDEAGRIWVGASWQQDAVVLTVKDTGIGIPAARLTRIFDMFAQVDGSLQRSRSGLGIGLTLVKRLVEMHGGTVEAHSSGPGAGSEFIVRLPMGADIDARAPDSVANAVISGTIKHRILVVDDNRDAATALAAILTVLGYDARSAFDGADALMQATVFRPEVVLLDLRMPRLNGFETAERLRAQAGGQSLVLIALTGYGQEKDRRRTAAAGFDHHWIKPVDPAMLETMLAGVTQAIR